VETLLGWAASLHLNTGDLSTVAADAEGTHGPACLKANVIMLLARAEDDDKRVRVTCF
jgi:hypothetical protein